ncbi:MAG: DUF1553 domain-containing protein [Aureliella sp.]
MVAKIVGAWIAALLLAGASPAGEHDVDYVRDIKPMLAQKCAACHGAIRQEAGLRLDYGDAIRLGGDSGVVVDSTDATASSVIERVTTDDPDLRMPPEGEGEALDESQVQLLVHWISSGALTPEDEVVPTSPEEHWSWQPLAQARTAETLGRTQSRPAHEVDALIGAAAGASDLEPLMAANPRQQLRRLYIDLTGLPPTPEQQRRFAAEPTDENWLREVDRLLSSPAYGQRWARHWMDVWRYSDWDGYKNELRGSQRHIWRWRDWIEESLCGDVGYDQMIWEMLAGDELAPAEQDTLRATGYLARNFHKSNRDIWLDATVEHTAKAFLGITINCAKCHDHKYDPISQKDYYAMRAVFEPHHVRTERVPGESETLKDGLVRAYDSQPDEPTYLYLAGNEKTPDKEHPIAPAVPAFFGSELQVTPVTLPRVAVAPATRSYVRREDIAAAKSGVAKAKKQFDESPNDVTKSALALAKANLSSLKKRWAADLAKIGGKHDDASRDQLVVDAATAEYSAKLRKAEHAVAVAEASLAKVTASANTGEDTNKKSKKSSDGKAEKDAVEAARQALKKLTESQASASKKYTPVVKQYPGSSTGRRLALAKWITDTDNPLAARVAVNHIWLRHFGQPIVASVFDFGMRCEKPKQWRVLDYLAAELMDSGWSLKHVHRIIVTSDAYRRRSSDDSLVAKRNQSIDPDNTNFWRANVRRLDAEAVRDQLIFAGDCLDVRSGGPDIDFREGERILRRSLYFRHAYEKQMTMLVLFDGAAPTECYQRSESIVPQQALTLANSPLSYDQARRIARSIWREAKSDSHAISLAFERLMCRSVTDSELETCLAFLAHQQQLLAEPSKLTALPGKSLSQTRAAQTPEIRARESLIHTLVNHNDFVTLR